jgi:hypothetical protein
MVAEREIVVRTPIGMDVTPFVTAKLVSCGGGPITMSKVTDPESTDPHGAWSTKETEEIGAFCV